MALAFSDKYLPMSSAASQPNYLRLVGTDDPDAIESWKASRLARQDVTRENRLAAGNSQLEPTDPRWVLAMRAYSQLQGSTLTPEKRQRVLDNAKVIGLRPFDANLIIAVVQDHARRGESPAEAQSTLSMIASPVPSGDRLRWKRWFAAVISAIVANILLIWWLTA